MIVVVTLLLSVIPALLCTDSIQQATITFHTLPWTLPHPRISSPLCQSCQRQHSSCRRSTVPTLTQPKDGYQKKKSLCLVTVQYRRRTTAHQANTSYESNDIWCGRPHRGSLKSAKLRASYTPRINQPKYIHVGRHFD